MKYIFSAAILHVSRDTTYTVHGFRMDPGAIRETVLGGLYLDIEISMDG